MAPDSEVPVTVNVYVLGPDCGDDPGAPEAGLEELGDVLGLLVLSLPATCAQETVNSAAHKTGTSA